MGSTVSRPILVRAGSASPPFALADLNGDGWLDALVGDSGRLRSLLGGPSGFTPGSAAIELTSHIGDIAAADWTGDGLADLAVAVPSPDGPVPRLWRGTGDGFEPAEPPESRTGSLQGVLLEDLDGDGRPELLERAEHTLWIRWNDGGRFGSLVPIRHSLYADYSVSAADLNGDGANDIALLFKSGGVLDFFLNAGARRWMPVERIHLPPGSRRLAVGNLIGDPFLELLIEREGGGVAVFSQSGALLRESLMSRAPVNALIAVDLDGDGLDDPVVFHGGSVCDGGSSLLEVRRSSDDGIVTPQARVPGVPSAVLSGDMDRDGDLDLVVLADLEEDGYSLHVLENRAAPIAADADSDGAPDECSMGDLNGNGAPDEADIASGASLDCDGDAVPDEVEPDCNSDGEPDDCDLLRGESGDANRNSIPDECELSPGDCNLNGISDALDLAAGHGDCDGDLVLDACETGPEVLLSSDYMRRIGLRSRPVSGFAADLDGDGDLDAAIGGSMDCCGDEPRGGSVEVILNDGDGGLVAAGLYRLRGEPIDIAGGDFDGDGDVDLVVLEGTSPCRTDARASVLINRGAGSLDRGPSAPFLPGVTSLEAGDLDGDGRLDFAAPHPWLEGGSILLFRSGRDGLEESRIGPPGGSTAIAAGDWNRDGSLDLATASASRGMTFILLGQGGGAFASGIAMGEDGRILQIEGSDIDGDGDLDLVCGVAESFGGGSFHCHVGDGVGGFTPGVLFHLSAIPRSTVMEDADGDGKEDLLFIAEGSRPELRLQVLHAVHLAGAEGMGPIEGWSSSTAYIDAGAAVAIGGDWNGDGRNDLIVAERDRGSIAVLRNSGKGSRFFSTTHFAAGDEAIDLEALELDGDGDLDLAWTDASRQELWTGINEGGAFRGAPSRLDRRVTALASGDIDLDGDADLAAAAELEVIWFANEGGGAVTRVLSQPVGSSPLGVVLSDLDGDGDLDTVTANSLFTEFEDNVSVFRNAGGGLFETARNYRTARGCTGFAAADMDSDGDEDLVVSAEGAVLLRNDGTGAFAGPERLHGVAGWVPPVLGDVDGDGDTDLITVSEAVLLFRNNGGAVLLQPETLGAVPGRVFRLADIDHDGDLDFIELDGYGDHWLEVHRNEGRGSFAGPIIHDAGQSFAPHGDESDGGTSGSSPGASDIAPGDLDGDGDLDLALGFSARSWITIAWNRTARAEPDLDGDRVPDTCRSPATPFRRGDVDSSGGLEITDAVKVLLWLFLAGEPLSCEKAADADDDGLIHITDAVRILNHLFLGEGPPPPPHPGCGSDTSPDALPCGEGCP